MGTIKNTGLLFEKPQLFRDVIIASLSFIVYSAVFIFFYNPLGGAIAALGILPVVIIAWLWGIKPSILAWLLIVLLNTLLFNIASQTGWGGIIEHNGIPGTLTVLAIGIIVGLLRDLRESMRRELAERIKAETALIKSEKNFKAMFNTAGEALHIIDLQAGRFIMVNPAMCKMFGYTSDELLELSPADLCASEEREKQKKALDILFSGGIIENNAGSRLHKDGSQFSTLISAHPIEWNGKKAIYGSIKDISEIISYQKKLEEKNKEIMDFAHILTHDMKNPLSSLMSICSVIELQEGLPQNEQDNKEMFAIAKQSMAYMHELIEDLLQCTRNEQETQVFDFREMNARGLVTSVIKKMKVQLEEKNIEIITDNADINFYADRNAITHVFINLLANAINYIGNRKNPRISIGSSSTGDKIEFYIQDNGIGIPQKEQSEIFQKFKRGRNSTEIKGTGLGLAIVKGAIEAHGGKVWLESKEGEGTTFHFSLPLKQ